MYQLTFNATRIILVSIGQRWTGATNSNSGTTAAWWRPFGRNEFLASPDMTAAHFGKPGTGINMGKPTLS
jgi:hypothetical protein